MQERGPRQPLTRQDRFFLRNAGLEKEDLWKKVEQVKKDPRLDIFSENFGRLQFDAKFDELKTRGVIREIFVITEQGKSDLADYERRRILPVRRPPIQQNKPLTKPEIIKTEPPKKPAPLVRPVNDPKPKEIKVKQKEKIGLGDLARFKDQFRPD